MVDNKFIVSNVSQTQTKISLSLWKPTTEIAKIKSHAIRKGKNIATAYISVSLYPMAVSDTIWLEKFYEFSIPCWYFCKPDKLVTHMTRCFRIHTYGTDLLLLLRKFFLARDVFLRKKVSTKENSNNNKWFAFKQAKEQNNQQHHGSDVVVACYATELKLYGGGWQLIWNVCFTADWFLFFNRFVCHPISFSFVCW